ncbi:MAG: SDR family NAD(P)-dependent oxidoreductase [Synechococcaceae cyanobacterium]|nr:SDR family NAD(P)-dependent oxidoreductase [Synechococcaceae cyanobacterium]
METSPDARDENPAGVDTGVLPAAPDVNRRPAQGACLLVLGGGYTGQRVAAAARRRGMAVKLTTREPSRCSDASAWLPFDSGRGLTPHPAALAEISHVLVTVPPDADGDDPCLRQLGPLLQALPLQWLGYLSTTGVYGDTGGAWVDETSPLRASSGRSQARIRAEQGWLDTGLPVQILRLPAIYGPGRCPFQGLLAGTSRLIHKPAQVFSRVHVDDIAGAVLHCLALPAEQRPPVLNVADDCPCPSSETLGFAAHLLGCRLPDVQPYGRIAGELSAMARSFWAENRRASNALLCQGLGYRLRYPSYREGFRASLAEERSAGQSPPDPGSVT